MKEAFRAAEKAYAQNEVPVGAIVVQGGKIIGRGHNLRETLQDPLSHAEIHALQGASQKLKAWRLEGCTLFVTLEPCPMCLSACQQARVDRVVYGAKDPKGGAITLGYKVHEDLRMNHRFSAEYLETPECEKILKDFFRETRSKKK